MSGLITLLVAVSAIVFSYVGRAGGGKSGRTSVGLHSSSPANWTEARLFGRIGLLKPGSMTQAVHVPQEGRIVVRDWLSDEFERLSLDMVT